MFTVTRERCVCVCFLLLVGDAVGAEFKVENRTGEPIYVWAMPEVTRKYIEPPLYIRRNGIGVLAIPDEGRCYLVVRDQSHGDTYIGWRDLIAARKKDPDAEIYLDHITITRSVLKEKWVRDRGRWIRRWSEVPILETRVVLSIGSARRSGAP